MTDLAKLAAILALPALAWTLPASTPAAAADAPTGKEVFLAQKCNTCHAIASQSIEMTSKTSKAPDLSNAGAHDSAFIQQWIKKEVAADDGKKHMPTWKGTDAELKTVADWLATLKK
jgi:mono/diheme cytochrome c family protein